MSRAQIWEAIYTTLITDQALLDLLGPVSRTNPRVLRTFPQLQALLTDYEPLEEGWLVFGEQEPSLHAIGQQQETSYDFIEPVFVICATHFSRCDDVTDLLDLSWHWSISQQRDVSYGEYFLLSSRRYTTKESYDKEVKLYRKDVSYRMELVLAEQIP